VSKLHSPVTVKMAYIVYYVYNMMTYKKNVTSAVQDFKRGLTGKTNAERGLVLESSLHQQNEPPDL
jgi:hypothetical protein